MTEKPFENFTIQSVFFFCITLHVSMTKVKRHHAICQRKREIELQVQKNNKKIQGHKF